MFRASWTESCRDEPPCLSLPGMPGVKNMIRKRHIPLMWCRMVEPTGQQALASKFGETELSKEVIAIVNL